MVIGVAVFLDDGPRRGCTSWTATSFTSTVAEHRGALGFFSPARVLLKFYMPPGIELGSDPTVFHRIDQCIESTAASALLAFVGTCQGAILFAEQNLFALMAAIDLSDDGSTFHLNAPS